MFLELNNFKNPLRMVKVFIKYLCGGFTYTNIILLDAATLCEASNNRKLCTRKFCSKRMKGFDMLLGHLSEFLIWFGKKGEHYLLINKNSIICPSTLFSF